MDGSLRYDNQTGASFVIPTLKVEQLLWKISQI